MSPSRSRENVDAVAHATDGGAKRHLLVDHLRDVGNLSAQFVTPFCDPAWGDLAGRWHDLGKYSEDFQRMIRSATGIDAHVEDERVPGRVDHSSAGAVHALRQLGDNMYGKAVAAVVAGHHCGLVDLTDLDARLAAKTERLASAMAGNPPPVVLDGVRPPRPPTVRTCSNPDDQRRQWELWVRMLFSALVDADSLDTEAFYSENAKVLRGTSVTIPTLRSAFERHVGTLAGEGPVNDARRQIQSACVAASAEPQGVFTLSVPTGGGKTFASTLFALAHAEAHGLRRVIIVPPFTSIIEQTARALRVAVGDEVVLEHHSAVDSDRQSRWNLLASENWDAPLIVTTAVQFFESLFARKRSRCRKLHNVARSVVVLDEAQTLPPTLLAPILDVLQTLVASYGVTLVLSTATQPALARRQHFPIGFDSPKEIAPAPGELARALRRVDVRWPSSLDVPEPWRELALRVTREPQTLSILHRKRDARSFTEEVDELVGGAPSVHLSANMCAAHRADVLEDVKASLVQGAPIRVVSTQVIEAGVDVDFPVVFRAMAGVDSLAQAAGRCNREGRLASGRLEVFLAETDPPMGSPLRGFQVAMAMLRANPGLDIFDPVVHDAFFRRFYADLSIDREGIQSKRAAGRFKEVADSFRIIDDNAVGVVVPYGDASVRVEALRRMGPSRERIRALQRYIVSMPRRTFETFFSRGAFEEVAETAYVLTGAWRRSYDDRFGLVLDDDAHADPSSFIA